VSSSCVACGSEAGAGAGFCSNCGRSLPQAAAEVRASATSPACESCASPLVAEALFCHRCGTRCGEASPLGADDEAATLILRSPIAAPQDGGVETQPVVKALTPKPAAGITTAADMRPDNAEVATVALERPDPRSERRVQPHTCSCGAPIVAGGRFCRACGAQT
jgi:hypothetical protein